MRITALFIILIFLVGGCSRALPDNMEIPGSVEENETENTEICMINEDGNTLETRINTPEGFVRTEAEDGSFAEFLREYEMKEDKSPVMLYDGKEKRNQEAHAAVFNMDMINGDLQQCADSIMRLYAEYYMESGQEEKIAFHYTDGTLCKYTDYNDFEKYLRMVFSYAGTLSMETYETETISVSEMQAGDIIINAGSPGHVVMIVDVCENAEGEKAYLLAQGYMPAQDFHVLKNPLHYDMWYYESEIQFPFETPEYIFDNINMVRRLTY